MTQPQPSAWSKNLTNMGIGGVAGTMAMFVVYPIESLKTIIQLRSESKQTSTITAVLKERFHSEGLMTLYRGVMAGAFRQFFFAGLRIGLYFSYADYVKSLKGNGTISLWESTLGSLAAGAIGISTVMPFDVIYVRFQVENALPPSQRRGYTGLFNAFSRIVKEEGAGTLWRGMIPAIARAMALNLGLLVPYEMCKKEFAKYLGYTRKNYLLSSAVAGLGASFCCLPFDNAKVKIQKMKPGPDGKMPYSGLVDCLVKTARKEGLRGLWSGFLAIYMVGAPFSMLALIISDAFRIMLGISKT